ncbi:DNA mismatch repair protein MutL [Candidatus Saganbacteria bacterium CG08_land_8_20_14_0_20_45_16]|uniref:DNA mismatch repair protein MutL n=1 Tax=Candidatus Saganbacteria bacterium CG08_land_8_20_14_0_20_45_16 TaxID=2014293 RepID=A0A2H0Y1H8_UNCSA|nr:MAG: DNA mismatch repair protein MutL [Candidatus Saganbacteria bacterium CG08_land_8_20_14_0_20_45_16]
MNRIQLLSEDLINKIAAGEVIERPASVVKELVENSLDAQATQITVETQGAGSKMIRVSDNGQGMSQDELVLALQRHSTSKINLLDDLFNIKTLGFRGEALPSIASVSRFEIRSNSHSLKIEGGKTLANEPIGAPAGTTVIVRDLFFNTPARKKFLKSPATEMGHLGDIVAKYALAFPAVSFQLISDGKLLLSSPGRGNLKEAVVSVYGVELSKNLIESSFEFDRGKVYGLISPPTISRLDKNYQTFFVNKRYVRNFLLNRALEEAYRTIIPNSRHPIAILFIDIDPKQVDINVHPAKREVKFLKTNEVMQAIREAVKKSLHILSPDPQPPAPNNQYPTPPHQNTWQPEMADFLFAENFGAAAADIAIEPGTAAQQLFSLYQLKNTYIVATDGESLVLIDQHAAHERIIYDALSPNINQNGTTGESRQSLLIPETIELNAKEKLVLADNLEYLQSLGFDLEEFGSNSYRLRAVPVQAAKATAKGLLLDIISELEALGKSVQLEIKQENIRKTIACKAAIKAGDKLSGQEMTYLIRDLYQTKNPATCPHGRPTMIKISEAELIKRFGRT